MTAIISDVHGNSVALRAVLEDIESAGITDVICLGDVVPGVDPAGCVDLLLQAKVKCIRGNAEENLCTPSIEGFPLRNSADWGWIVPFFTWIRDVLPRESLDAIRSWPSELRRRGTWFIHDSPIDRITFPGSFEGLPPAYLTLFWHGDGIARDANDAVMDKHRSIAVAHGISQIFFGHTHEAWTRCFDGVVFTNVGSAGMPLDNEPRPSWVAWDGREATVYRTRYDFDALSTLIDASDHPRADNRRYKEMFRTGMHWREVC